MQVTECHPVTWLPVISYNIHRENLVWEQGITIKQPDSYCHNLQCMDCPKRRKIGWAHARFWSIFYCYLPLTQSRLGHFLWVGKCPDKEWGQKNRMRLDLNWPLSSAFTETRWSQVCWHSIEGYSMSLWSWQCPGCHICVSDHDYEWLVGGPGTTVTNSNDVLDGKKCY